MCKINTELLNEEPHNTYIYQSPQGQLPSNIIRYQANEITQTEENKYTPQLSSLDTNKLIINAAYSYKELCTLLDQEYKSSNAKQHQLIEWSRFFNYEKVGTKYLITEIYNPPIEFFPLDKTPNKKDNYIDHIMAIILSYLFATGKQILYLTHFEICIICGLINQLYEKYYSDKQSLSKELLIPVNDIDDFYILAQAKTKSLLRSALTQLQDRRIITYIPTSIIIYRTSSIQSPVLTYEFREVSDAEKIIISGIEYEALQSLNLTKINDLWYKPKSVYEQYSQIRQKLMYEHNPYWLKIYDTTKILANYNTIRKEANTTYHKQQLNIKMYKYLNDTSVKQAAQHLPPLTINTTADEWIQAKQTILNKLILIFENPLTNI